MDRPGNQPPTTHSQEYKSDLIDVSSRTALELLTSGDPRIVDAVRRLLAARAHPREVTMGFTNFVDVEFDRLPDAQVPDSDRPNPMP